MPHPRLRPGYPLFLFSLIVGTTLAVAGLVWAVVSFWSSQFPDVRILKSQYPVVVQIRQASNPKRGGQPFLIRWSKKRPDSWTSLSSVSPLAVGAVVVSEDWAFFSHRGYDSNQIREALKHDLEQGTFARGASTITQQVAKNVFLTQEKSLWRKAKELLLAIRMDRELGKRKVLETYMNVVEWGPGVFGIQAASSYYFGKPPSALTAREGAFLAMLLPSPVRYSQSFRQRKLTGYARSTVSRILTKMSRAGYLTPEEADEARRERMRFELSEPDGSATDETDNDDDNAEAPAEDGPEVEETPEAPLAEPAPEPTEEIDREGGAEDT